MRNNLFLILYDGKLKNENVRKIHKRLLDETINSQRIKETKKKIDKDSTKKLQEIRELEGGSLLIFCMLLAKKKKGPINLLWKNYDNSNKVINQEVREQEEIDKDKYIHDLAENDDFYVASAHGDSAEDHKPYQGKVYYNKDATYSKEAKEYIKKHNIKSMQWVVGAPVYFITRPHCRHYFVTYNEKDILSNNFTVPYHQVGPRGPKSLQTPRGKKLKYYEQRLRMLKVLENRYKTDDLTNKIRKTEIIIKKYKKSF